MSKRLTDWERNQMNNKVRQLITRRIQMAKFPIEDDGLYDMWCSLVPPNVVTGIKYLVNNPPYDRLVNGDWSIDLVVGELVIRIDPHEPQNWRTGRDGLVIPPNHQLYSPIRAFAELRHKTDTESDRTQRKAEALVSYAGAAGQIKRAWPELASFLSPEAKDSVRSVQRASRLPNGFNVQDFNEYKELYNRVLAEAFILPEPNRSAAQFGVYVR